MEPELLLMLRLVSSDTDQGEALEALSLLASGAMSL